MKQFCILISAMLFSVSINAQILYSHSFGNLPLQTYTSGATVTQFTNVPSQFSVINDGHNNAIGSASNPNAPFHVPSLKTTGWAVVYNSLENDTFLVSTSWLDSSLTSSRWVITPPVTNIGANTVLTWLAKSPDASYADGYEVYATNKTGTLVAGDFTAGDKLFSIADGSVTGGGEKSSWTRRSVSLGALSGQTIRFAFRNNSTNMYQLWIDDIEVKTLTNNLDGSPVSIVTDKYILTNTTHTLKINYTNFGSAVINTVTMNYQYGNSAVTAQTFTFTEGLNYLQSSELAFSLGYSLSSPGNYALKVWASSVNGTNDQNLANDTAYFNVTVQATSPKKNILVEQFVSAEDGESPDAQDKALALQKAPVLASDSIIVVNIHGDDSLTLINSSNPLNVYKKQFATAMIDRQYYSSTKSVAVSRSYYTGMINARAGAVTPASVTITNKTFNTSTKELSFTLKADFTGEVKGDYRLNAYLIENHVHGKLTDTTINGFNQESNYYNVPWSAYYQQGYYSPAENAWILNAWIYKHQRVLIHAFDGGFGSSGLIPQNGGTAGQSYQTTFSLAIPTSTNGVSKYNADNLYIVGFVAEYSNDVNQRTVLNSVMEKVNANSEAVGLTERENEIKIVFYPNPTDGSVFISSTKENYDYLISVYDLTGRKVYTKQVVNAFRTEKVDLTQLSEGAYLVTIDTGEKVFREKIVVSKK